MEQSLEIGFVVALQHLPARSRALLLLRDVERFSAGEAAEILDEGEPWVGDELARARATLDRHRRPRRAPPPSPRAERVLVTRFVSACETADQRALAALLAADALLTVPAAGFELRGRHPVRHALPTGPNVRLLTTRANGAPACACYVRSGARLHADSLYVLTLEGEHVAVITGFPGARVLRPFGLPRVI